MVATGVLDGANSATFVEGMEVATVDFGSETKGEIFSWKVAAKSCILYLFIKIVHQTKVTKTVFLSCLYQLLRK